MAEEKRGVLDYREHKFVQVTKSVIDDVGNFDKPVDKLVYVILCSYANNETKKSYPSVKSIADKAACSENTVRTAIKRLIELQLIKVEPNYNGIGKQTSNIYTLLEPPESFRGFKNDNG